MELNFRYNNFCFIACGSVVYNTVNDDFLCILSPTTRSISSKSTLHPQVPQPFEHTPHPTSLYGQDFALCHLWPFVTPSLCIFSSHLGEMILCLFLSFGLTQSCFLQFHSCHYNCMVLVLSQSCSLWYIFNSIVSVLLSLLFYVYRPNYLCECVCVYVGKNQCPRTLNI